MNLFVIIYEIEMRLGFYLILTDKHFNNTETLPNIEMYICPIIWMQHISLKFSFLFSK